VYELAFFCLLGSSVLEFYQIST